MRGGYLMKVGLIGVGFLIASAIMLASHYITAALIGLLENRVGENLNFGYSQPLFILSLLFFVLSLLLFGLSFKQK